MLEVTESCSLVSMDGQIWVPQKGIVWPCGRSDLSRLTQFVLVSCLSFPTYGPLSAIRSHMS